MANNFNTIDTLEDRITQLEIKIAYMENFIDQLQEMSIEQNKNMTILQAANKNLAEKISEISEQVDSDIPNRRPPHY